jgi:hypothetical protein
MTEATVTVAEFREDAARRAASEDGDVLRAVEKARASLDAVEMAVRSGLSVPASVTGSPFFQDDANRVTDAIRDRQAAHEAIAAIDLAVKIARAEQA